MCVKGIGGGGSSEGYEITYLENLFYYSRSSLYDVWVSRIKSPTDVSSLFYYADDISNLDLTRIDFSKCNTFTRMFSFSNIKVIDVSSVDMSSLKSGGANYMFSYCNAEEILGVGRNANINYNFRDWLQGVGTSLKRLTISPYAKGMNQPIDIENCSFTREAMVELFESLPATCTSTITITGNPCVTDGTLTAEDKAIATNKGCTIVEA